MLALGAALSPKNLAEPSLAAFSTGARMFNSHRPVLHVVIQLTLPLTTKTLIFVDS